MRRFYTRAETLWIEGMGHDLPDIFVDVVVEKMIANFQRAKERLSSDVSIAAIIPA